MKKILISFTAMISLAACATNGPTAFGPVNAKTDIGFSNTKIEKDRFRVGFTARSDLEAKDFALLRAAQIAQTEGFSHFEILTGNVTSNGPNSPIGTSIGIGSGRFGRHSHSNVGVGVDVADIGRVLEGDKFTHMIEVRLKNSAGTTPNSYEAQSVISSIRPAVFK